MENNMDKFAKLIAATLLGMGAILWPYWLLSNTFSNWYPAVGSFIAIYGGLYGLYKLWKR
jgi:ABC-type Fe3+-siderophore transport system permease subunit